MMSGATFVTAEEAIDLKVGDAAPVFEVEDDKGESWKSQDHVGKRSWWSISYPT